MQIMHHSLLTWFLHFSDLLLICKKKERKKNCTHSVNYFFIHEDCFILFQWNIFVFVACATDISYQAFLSDKLTMHKYMRPLCYVEKYLWQQVFSEHFKSFSTCKKNEFTVHVCTIYMHVHRTKTSTFIKLCHSDENIWCLFFSRWFPEVQVMFYEGNKRKQVPSNQDPEKLESFFNCAATLMTDNLQQLTLNSLDDYSDLLCQPPVRPITKLYKSFLIKFLLLYVSVENSFLY